jgi:hypothetical protein
MSRKRKTQSVVRDSRTGRFVPKREAKRRPATTQTERNPIGRPKKKKKGK